MTEASKSAAVVAAWFAGNAILAALLPAFGERAFAVLLYAVATALPAAAAALVLAFAGRNAGAEEEFTLSAHAIWAMPAALGIVLIGVGSFAGIWLVWVGGIGVLVACVELLRGSERTGPEVADGAS